jgi:hypothetical protein
VALVGIPSTAPSEILEITQLPPNKPKNRPSVQPSVTESSNSLFSNSQSSSQPSPLKAKTVEPTKIPTRSTVQSYPSKAPSSVKAKPSTQTNGIIHPSKAPSGIVGIPGTAPTNILEITRRPANKPQNRPSVRPSAAKSSNSLVSESQLPSRPIPMKATTVKPTWLPDTAHPYSSIHPSSPVKGKPSKQTNARPFPSTAPSSPVKGKPSTQTNEVYPSKAASGEEIDLGSNSTASRLHEVQIYLARNGVSSLLDLETPSKPQYLAAEWLADRDKMSLAIPNTTSTAASFKQRYVVALLYFAFQGKGWTHQVNFLSRESECTWFNIVRNGETVDLVKMIGVTCSADFQVSGIKLGK